METTVIEPKILYYGTPVILLNTLNEDGTINISPMSSSWALGSFVTLGIGLGGKAIENLKRHPECVINVPSPALWKHVERIASYTGTDPVPDWKHELGFTYKKDKHEASGLTAVGAHDVAPSRLAEFPLQLEAKVHHIREPEYASFFAIVETEVVCVHAHKDIVLDEHHVDPSRWSPLIYNFRHYFGLAEQSLGKTFRA
ncbi:flavin reductase family protein [Bacillus sp. FSL W7-1360]